MGKLLRLLASLALLFIIRRHRARTAAIVAQQVHTAPRRAEFQIALLAIMRRHRARVAAITAQQVYTAPRREELQIARSATFVPLDKMGHSLDKPLRLLASPALLAIMRCYMVRATAIIAQQAHTATRQEELTLH